jgi:membrane fusion protein (multidrug efflux system)
MDSRQLTPTTPRAKTVHLIWRILPRLPLLGMIVLIIILFGAISKKKESIASDKAAAVSQERPPVNTVLYAFSPTEIRDKINLPGNIEPWTRLELMAKVGGAITEVLVIEGDEVKEGDVLARIEANDYRIRLQRAKAGYKLAKANFQRDKKVYAKGVIPTAELDAKETAMETAKADLDNAELQLSRCEITAPINGVIRRLDAKVGLLLSIADPVAEILKIDKVKAVIGIPESDISAVSKLNEVEITIKSLDNLVIMGKKHFLSSSPDTAARLYRMELELDNPSRSILPGMFVRAEVVKKSIPNAITIPFYSVISRNNEQYVFVEENGAAQKRVVELGIMESWLVEVKSGLSFDDKLIIEGHRDVENDQKIKAVKVLTDLGEYTL